MSNKELIEEIIRRLRTSSNTDIWITADDEIYTDSELTHREIFNTLDSLELEPLSDSEIEDGIRYYGIHFV